MRAFVFTDASLVKQAGRFVWLSIDTEKAKNAAFVAKYPIESWPTLMVIDPEREEVVLRWPGSATVPELVKLLDDGERGVRKEKGGDALAELARADRLAAAGQAEAADAYRALLPRLPPGKRSRAIESLLNHYCGTRDFAGCAKAAVELVPSLPRAAGAAESFANATALGLTCAGELDDAARTRAQSVLAPLGEEAVKLPGLLADDRSGLYELLVDAREKAGDASGKKALAARWLAFVDGEAARAKTPEQRAAFDPHRVLAAIAVGEPLRAEAALKQSERDLPGDYNAPARLALIYGKLGRYDDALAAINRALGKVYGPRALRLLEQKADFQENKGDKRGAIATLESALVTANALPGAGRAVRVAKLKERVEKLRAESPR
jgi:tetratricopeptide (TPR) repeat protein